MAVGEAAYNAFNNIVIDFQEAFSVEDITTDKIKKQRKLWFEMYFDSIEDCEIDTSQRLPYVIVDGLDKACFGEYKYSIDETGEKGKRLALSLDKLENRRPESFQLTNIGGEGYIKPVPYRKNFVAQFVPSNNYLVFSKDVEGEPNSVGMWEKSIIQDNKKKVYYTLLERRTLTVPIEPSEMANNELNSVLVIEYKLFRSEDEGSLGNEITDLASVADILPQYARLQPRYIYEKPFENLGMVHIKMPMRNCVDFSSDGVAIYAVTYKRIMEAYWHERRTHNEFELTEPHALVSVDALRKPPGVPEDEFTRHAYMDKPPPYIQSAGNFDMADLGVMVYNPAPNQQQLEARCDQILRDIENTLGLRRGFLSQMQQEEVTATEIVSTSTKMAHLCTALQNMWDGAIKEYVKTCDLWGQIFYEWDSSEPPEPVIEWGNGILYDEDKDWNQITQLRAQGDIFPEIPVGWKFNMPYDTPEEREAIRIKYMPDLSTPDDGEKNEQI